MKIQFPDEIAKNKSFSEKELLEVLAVSLYKIEKINGFVGGHILGYSEIDFHGVLKQYRQYVNYVVDDLQDDLDNLKDY